MARNLNNPSTHRDYGATSSGTGPITHMPDVEFSGFSPTEFMSLSEDIAQNITAVKSSSKQLEKVLKIIGTPRDQPSARDKVHNIRTKSNTRIELTSKDLQRLNAVVRRGDKKQKLQLEKLTNDFRTVVDNYLDVQQRIVAAIKQTNIQSQIAQLQDEEGESDRNELLQRQQQMQATAKFEHDMFVERERQIKEIEDGMLNINTIMRTVSTLVQAQGEQVGDIESSIENAAAEVELGREELAKASAHRQSYRRKILILLAIAVIIGLIVTGIIVGKLQS